MLKKSKFSKEVNQVRSAAVLSIICQGWEAILLADLAVFQIGGDIILISC
jgi:hypothetical protein